MIIFLFFGSAIRQINLQSKAKSAKKKKNVFGNRTDVITAKFWEALLSKQVIQDFVLVLPYRI